MDFTLPRDIEHIRRRVRIFVEEHVLPTEADRANWDEHDYLKDDVLASLRARARGDGLWAPQVPVALGGMGLLAVGSAAIYEEAGYSLFGPAVFNCASPDDGNMNLINRIGTAAQKERWLRPIVEGRVRSAFAMTEPPPGGGSDPGMIRTNAERRGDTWVVDGEKAFITGAGVAEHFILVARTDPDPAETRRHLTAFLFHKDQPGWSIRRRIGTMGPQEPGGQCDLVIKGLEIPDENRLMQVGDGLKAAQIRLWPTRLANCMRWLGLAKRSLSIARQYASKRRGFGTRLIDRESVQLKLGKAARDIEIGRLLVMKAAWKLDEGDYARKEVAMAKVHVADALHEAVDTAIQLTGARGYSTDTVLEWIYRYARRARLDDGPSEVHEMVLAHYFRREGDDFWRWGA